MDRRVTMLSGSERRPCRVKVRDVIRRLERDGWVLVTTKGSHRQFEHPTKPSKVTVAGHPSDEVPPKTLKRIWEQAGYRHW